MIDAQRKDGQGKSGGGKARRVNRTDADHPANENQLAADPRFTDTDADGSEEGSSSSDGEPGESGDGTAAPKKRRRRRRKTTGEGGASPASDRGAGG